MPDISQLLAALGFGGNFGPLPPGSPQPAQSMPPTAANFRQGLTEDVPQNVSTPPPLRQNLPPVPPATDVSPGDQSLPSWGSSIDPFIEELIKQHMNQPRQQLPINQETAAAEQQLAAGHAAGDAQMAGNGYAPADRYSSLTPQEKGLVTGYTSEVAPDPRSPEQFRQDWQSRNNHSYASMGMGAGQNGTPSMVQPFPGGMSGPEPPRATGSPQVAGSGLEGKGYVPSSDYEYDTSGLPGVGVGGQRYLSPKAQAILDEAMNSPDPQAFIANSNGSRQFQKPQIGPDGKPVMGPGGRIMDDTAPLVTDLGWDNTLRKSDAGNPGLEQYLHDTQRQRQDNVVANAKTEGAERDSRLAGIPAPMAHLLAEPGGAGSPLVQLLMGGPQYAVGMANANNQGAHNANVLEQLKQQTATGKARADEAKNKGELESKALTAQIEGKRREQNPLDLKPGPLSAAQAYAGKLSFQQWAARMKSENKNVLDSDLRDQWAQVTPRPGFFSSLFFPQGNLQ